MKDNIVIVAPFNNKKAWESADFICDGINDEVEIQAALELASKISIKGIQFRRGTFRIRNFYGNKFIEKGKGGIKLDD